jgi:hypothetical protein
MAMTAAGIVTACRLVGSECNYSSPPVSTGNMFQDLPRLPETADNTERYVQGDRKASVHLMITIQKVKSNVQSVPRQSPDFY